MAARRTNRGAATLAIMEKRSTPIGRAPKYMACPRTTVQAELIVYDKGNDVKGKNERSYNN
jgi:hypothetical protein